MIEHYPQTYGPRADRKALTRAKRRADDRLIAVGLEHVRPESHRKDTRRWCRGKVGVEHQTARAVWFDCEHLPSSCNGAYYKDVCQVCGRVVRTEFRPKD